MQRESLPVPLYAEAWFRKSNYTLRPVWHPEYILLNCYRLRSTTQLRQGNNVCSLTLSTAPGLLSTRIC